MHYFDYNTDHFGVGTIDAPEWRIDDRKHAYATRAGAARAGLYGNHGYEADYEIVCVDADGEQLNGSHRYELRLASMPPVDASGDFRPIMRMYQPKPEVLSRDYVLPAISNVG
jgi:hypothetical protein